MYRIVINGITIYNSASPSLSNSLIEGSLDLAENTAGTLTFTYPPQSIAYDMDELGGDTIMVFRSDMDASNEQWLWSGRWVDNMEVDIDKNTTMTFEGALAFLNDTHQESHKYENYTMQQFITALLNAHNTKVGDNRKIYVGAITVNDGIKDRYTEYESTMQCIQDLITDNGGHVQIRYDKDTDRHYLDYLADYNGVIDQFINFGKNLIDYTANYSRKDYATVVLPLGKEDEETHERLTVASVNHGSIYVVSEIATLTGVWIEKLYDDSSIETPEVLLQNAQQVLAKSLSAFKAEYNVTAVDLHNLDNNVSRISLYDTVRVISAPHNLDEQVPVVELSLDLLNPSNDRFTLGKVVESSMTSNSLVANENMYKDLQKKIEGISSEIPDPENILEQAQINATQLINSATTGYVTVRNNAIYISNAPDYSESTELWTWNINGLGYSSDGGETYGTAITMDGSIVANYITAGTMSADRVRTGLLMSQNGNTQWDLNTGEFTMKKGEIKLGARSSANYYTDLNNLYIDDDGNIYTTGNIILASPESDHDTGWMAFGKTGRSKQVESMFGIYYEHGSFYFFGADTVDDLSPYRDGYIRGLAGVGTNQAGLELRCEPGKNATWTYGRLNFVCGKLSLTGEDSSHNSVSGIGYTGSKVIDGVTYNFINGILLE